MTSYTRTGFKEWLEGHRPRQIVGKACNFDECPVARYRGKGAFVSPSNPRWADRFIDALDRDMDVDQQVTAARALRILNETWRPER